MKWWFWAGFVVVVAIIGALLPDSNDDAESAGASTTVGSDVEIVEWSIVLADYDGSSVRLTGELPNGYPTETYRDDELLGREEDGDFSWSLGPDNEGEPVPSPVFAQQSMDCATLASDYELWDSLAADQSNLPDLTARTQAFAQSALDLAEGQGC